MQMNLGPKGWGDRLKAGDQRQSEERDRRQNQSGAPEKRKKEMGTKRQGRKTQTGFREAQRRHI